MAFIYWQLPTVRNNYSLLMYALFLIFKFYFTKTIKDCWRAPVLFPSAVSHLILTTVQRQASRTHSLAKGFGTRSKWPRIRQQEGRCAGISAGAWPAPTLSLSHSSRFWKEFVVFCRHSVNIEWTNKWMNQPMASWYLTCIHMNFSKRVPCIID